MVTIKKEAQDYIFEVRGLRKLWAMKSSITVPSDKIVSAHKNKMKISNHINRTFPDKNVSGVIASGVYNGENGKVFCDVVDKSNAIVVQLKNADFDKLVIEVENPNEAIELLTTQRSFVN